jgi:hypothetical protein
LILSFVTPRLDVLAVLTGEGEVPVVACSVEPEFAVCVEVADDPQDAVPTMVAAISVTARTLESRGDRARK